MNVLDTRAKSGTRGSIRAFRAHSAPKYWAKRTCIKCEETLLEGQDFDTVALNRRNDIIVHHSYCRRCRAKIRAEWEADSLYSAELESFWRQYMPGLRSGAYGRSLLVAIDVEDLLGLYIKQRGCCAISGLELDWRVKGRTGRANRAHLRPSIDRIDSNRNYTIDNVQVVAQAINLMKGALPQSSFIEICGAVARHNISF